MTLISTRLTNFTLRRAEPEHAGLLLQFMRKLGAFQAMKDEITASETSLWHLLASGRGQAVFGLWDSTPVGFMFYNETSSAFTGRSGLFIDAFLVDATHRHLGLGRIMMEFLAKETRARGGEMLEWGCMDDNTGAIEFYRRLGAYCLDGMHIYRLSPEDVTRHAAGFTATGA